MHRCVYILNTLVALSQTGNLIDTIRYGDRSVGICAICFAIDVKACIEAAEGQVPRGTNVWQSFADDRSTLEIGISELTQDRIPKAQEARER